MAINKKMKIWNIQQTKGFLGEDICHLLPFLHSLTGCDSTSRFFGIGKGIALKKIRIINCILISYVILIELFTKDIYKRLLVMTV
jgi:hypothetical protein